MLREKVFGGYSVRKSKLRLIGHVHLHVRCAENLRTRVGPINEICTHPVMHMLTICVYHNFGIDLLIRSNVSSRVA